MKGDLASRYRCHYKKASVSDKRLTKINLNKDVWNQLKSFDRLRTNSTNSRGTNYILAVFFDGCPTRNKNFETILTDS